MKNIIKKIILVILVLVLGISTLYCTLYYRNAYLSTLSELDMLNEDITEAENKISDLELDLNTYECMVDEYEEILNCLLEQ